MEKLIAMFLTGLVSSIITTISITHLITGTVESNTDKYCKATYTEASKADLCKKDLKNLMEGTE